MSQSSDQCAGNERVYKVLEMLLEGQTRDRIADQFGYSTWKSLDIYMRRHGFCWDSQSQIYTQLESKAPAKEVYNLKNVEPDSQFIDPTEIVRLFSLGILDAREIAKRVGFSGHKEMASYMLRQGYVWSSSSQNYENQNSSHPSGTSIDYSSKDRLPNSGEMDTEQSLLENIDLEKYGTLLEFLWHSRDKLIKVIEETNIEEKIRIYHIPGQAKTKSIFLSDSLTDLMTALCKKHSLSQKQGYEAALVEYLAKKGFHEEVNRLLEASENNCD